MICSQTKPSVSSEVGSGLTWLGLNVMFQALSYYFTVHQRNDDITWLSNKCLPITGIGVIVAMHRMKVARVQANGVMGADANDPSEPLWSHAVFLYFGAMAILFWNLGYVSSLESRPIEYTPTEGWCIFNRDNWEDSGVHPNSMCLRGSDTLERIPAESFMNIYLLFGTTLILDLATVVYLKRYEVQAGDINSSF
jgi:hypothetical protein